MLNPGSTQTLLIVDDSPENIKILHQILKDKYTIYFATNGNKALELAHRHNPDLILLDIMMPEMDGYTTCIKLKEAQQTQDIPVIFITALTDEEKHIHGLEVGAVDYITKPFHREIIKLRVNLHLELKRHRDYFEQLSYLDGLTGLANRLRFDTIFAYEWEHSTRRKDCLALLLLDIDYFKQYNDTYGHLLGDDCLKRVSQCLQKSVNRSSDLVSRYGGEEFIVLLPSTDLAGAQIVAERIRQNIEALHIPHLSSQHKNVTISLGVGSIAPRQGQKAQDFLQNVDDALYRAKSHGRNCLKTVEK